MHAPRTLQSIEVTSSKPIGQLPCFGTVVFELRAKSGLSQRALARLTGMQPSAISDFENLRRPPPQGEHLAALSRVLATDVQQRSLLRDLAQAERRATSGLRISRHTPRRVAVLLREIAMRGEALSDRHIAALRAQLEEVTAMQ